MGRLSAVWTGLINRLSCPASWVDWLARMLICGAALIVCLHNLSLSIAALRSPLLERKDLLQDYLMARALREGLDPYLPLADLAQRFMPEAVGRYFAHPSPHPFAAALWLWAFSFVSFQAAARMWLFCDLVLLFLSAWLAGRILPRTFSVSGKAFLLVFLLGSRPVTVSLITGQFNITLMLLALLLLWRGWKNDMRHGVLLGLMLSIKFFGWPILAAALLKRNWRTVFAAAVVFGTLQLAHGMIAGRTSLFGYYSKVLPSVAAVYQADSANQSLLLVGQRLFSGMRMQSGPAVPPLLLFLPGMAGVFNVLFAAFLLAAVFRWVLLRHEEQATSAILIMLSAIASPLVWIHSAVLALPGLIVTAKELERGVPTFAERASFFLLLVLFYCGDLPANVVQDSGSAGWWLSLMTVLPLLTMAGSIALLMRLGGSAAQGNSVHRS